MLPLKHDFLFCKILCFLANSKKYGMLNFEIPNQSILCCDVCSDSYFTFLTFKRHFQNYFKINIYISYSGFKK